MKRHARKSSDDVQERDNRSAYILPSALRDTSAPCASGDKCMTDPPARVEIRGEQCGACRFTQEKMRRELRARQSR